MIREHILWVLSVLGMDGRDLDLFLRGLRPLPPPQRSGFVSLPPGYEPAIPVAPRIFPDVLVWIGDRLAESYDEFPGKPKGGSVPDQPILLRP
jgi:hypothetical protein